MGRANNHARTLQPVRAGQPGDRRKSVVGDSWRRIALMPGAGFEEDEKVARTSSTAWAVRERRQFNAVIWMANLSE
jgi:hypothetical protein